MSEWLSSINQQTANAGEDVEKKEPSYTTGMNADWCNHCGRQYGVSSKKLKMDLSYDLMIPLLEIYPKKPEILIQKNICTPVPITVLFKIS